MKVIFSILLVLCFWNDGNCQAFKNEAVIWQGFSHTWTYNHRINRIGDFVQLDPTLQVKKTHTSASGLGADSTYFASNYCLLQNVSADFLEGKTQLNLSGKEKEFIIEKKLISIPIDSAQQDFNFATLLNGFDMIANKKADKIQHLSINITDPIFNSEQSNLEFQIEISLVVNCQSLECEGFNKKADYQIDIYYLLIAAPSQSFLHQLHPITNSYSWDKKTEAKPENKTVEIRSNHKAGVGNFPIGTVGIKSISLNLDQDHWFVEWNNHIQAVKYFAGENRFVCAINLSFKEWLSNMKKESAVPKHSRFSMKKKGWASLGMTLVSLQFKDGRITKCKLNGAMFWPGKNISAEDARAVQEN